MDHIRRPVRAAEVGNFIRDPGRRRAEDGRRAGRPVQHVGRAGKPDAVAGGEVEIRIAVARQGAGVVRVRYARQVDRLRVGAEHQAECCQQLFHRCLRAVFMMRSMPHPRVGRWSNLH
ncbi:hypothetical protein D3C81_994080 [compost metagenome]